MPLINLQITSGTDDAWVYTEAGSTVYNDADVQLTLGKHWNVSGQSATDGLRFQNVGIPANATINSAVLRVIPYYTVVASIKVRVSGEASINSATFSSVAHPGTRPKTQSNVAWDISNWPLVADLDYTTRFSSPDLAPVIQEIVNQPGWSSGNSLTLIINDDGSDDWSGNQMGTFNDGAPAFLDIDYTVNSEPDPEPEPDPVKKSYLRGYVIAGGEYGDNGSAYGATNNSAPGGMSYTNPGTYGDDYLYPAQGDFEYIKQRNPIQPVTKLMVRMERLTSGLSQPLRSAEITRITSVLDGAQAAGVGVILNPWNFGAVWIDNGSGTAIRNPIENGTFTQADFNDFFIRVMNQWGNHPALIGIELMTEPVDIPGGASAWEVVCQSALDAIRTVSRDMFVWVPNYGWGINEINLHSNGPWIIDPTGNFGYTGHQYNYNRGGSQTDYTNALQSAVSQGFTAGENIDALHTREIASAAEFHNWLNGHTGFISEYGIPQAENDLVPDSDGPKWIAFGQRLLEEYDKYGWGATIWTSGRVLTAPTLYTVYYPSAGYNTNINSGTSIAATVEAHPSFLAPPPAKTDGQPSIVRNNVEVTPRWYVYQNGVEVPLSWGVVINGSEVPLAGGESAPVPTITLVADPNDPGTFNSNLTPNPNDPGVFMEILTEDANDPGVFIV